MVPSSDYLSAVRALCTERDALLMVDEVQTGLGRIGHWFAFQAQGLAARRGHHGQGAGQRHAGGCVLGSCRGGRRLQPGRPRIDLRRATARPRRGPGDPGRDGGRGRAAGGHRRAGALLAEGLGSLPGVVAVRGAGLLLAAQLADSQRPREASQRALERGLLVNPVRPDALRLAPPLLVGDDEIEAALGIWRSVLVEG